MHFIIGKGSALVRTLLAIAFLVGIAAALRIWPLSVLGAELIWLTFYPAVVIVALYEGFVAGVIASILSCFAVILLRPLFTESPIAEDLFDLLNMAMFVMLCGVVSYFVGSVQRIKNVLAKTEMDRQASVKREQFIGSIIDASPSMIGYWGADLTCRYANHAYTGWFEKAPHEIVGIAFQELVDEQLFALNKPYIERVLAGEAQRFERTLRKTDGSEGHIIGHYIPDVDANGEVLGFSILANEVTVFKETEEELKLAACVFDSTLDGILITDTDGVILSVNPAFTEITGYTAEDVIGETPRILQSNRHDQAFYNAMWDEIKVTSRWTGEIWNRRKDGALYLERLTISMVPDKTGEPVRYVSVFNDITALRRKDEHIKHLAFHDALTDLPNRTLLMDRINQKVIYADRRKCNLAVLFLDLDGFKLVNDRFGHNVGDSLLKEVATRLLALVRGSDTVARVGGDEFLFLLSNAHGKVDIEDVAQRIIDSINTPFEIHGDLLHIGGSIGVAMFPADGETAMDLINHADIAMYASKRLGRNNISFYSPNLDITSASRGRFG